MEWGTWEGHLSIGSSGDLVALEEVHSSEVAVLTGLLLVHVPCDLLLHRTIFASSVQP